MDFASPVSDLPHIGPAYDKKLTKLGIKTIKDLLEYVPLRYIDFSKNTPIKNIHPGETTTIKGELAFLKNQYTKSGRKMQLGEINDGTGSIKVVWFNQPFLTRVLYPKDHLSLSGKIDWLGREMAMISPEYEKMGNNLHTGRLVPVYPSTAGLTSKWLRARIDEALKSVFPTLKDYLPQDIIKKYHLKDVKQAISSIHYPKNWEDTQTGRERFAFEELLRLHLLSIIKKKNWLKNNAKSSLKLNSKDLRFFIKNLKFKLTHAQTRCIQELLRDLNSNKPMNRLLEGDVGFGKTVVASLGMLAAKKSGYQTIFMAPTQILATQHFKSLKGIFLNYDISIDLIMGGKKEITKHQKADIIIGTHALLHYKNIFDKVGFIVIDEQHKFGVDQRNLLIKNAKSGGLRPHVLTMTATPIPRTIALTLYGDMDLSIIDEMPPGRIKPVTWLVPPEKRNSAYRWIEETITKISTQAFFVYPLIDTSDSLLLLNIKAVTTEYKNLIKIFNKRKVGLLHGRLKNSEKESVVNKFTNKKVDILVTTPVIEVGIDIPNANIMVIESADRFGLSQLHQLRGRVGRGNTKSYCLLITESSSEKVFQRLEVLKMAKSGYDLSELDLKLRGPGEVFGTKQHGLPELKIASWQDINLIKASKEAAMKLALDKASLKSVAPFLFQTDSPQ